MPKFQQRHYEAIADTLQSCEPYCRDGFEIVVQKFANMLENDNPKFGRTRFKNACQPGANVRAKS